MHVLTRRTLRVWAALGLVASGLAFAAPGPARADDDGASACLNVPAPSTDTGEPPPAPYTGTDVVAKALDVEAFQQAVVDAGAPSPGHGVTVAVVDSGVAAVPGLHVIHSGIDGALGTVGYYQGTALAGIVAGPPSKPGGPPVGVAPGATIADVHVFDTAGSSSSTDQGKPVDAGRLAAGLDLVAQHARAFGIKVVLVGSAIKGSSALAKAVHSLTGQGVIVVAPTGDRQSESGDPSYPSGFATPQPGEDVASLVFPAGYALDPTNRGLVVAVNTTVPNGVSPTSISLLSSATDVASPSQGAVSYALDGRTCEIGTASTMFAAAEVAGVLAALRSVPGMTAPQAVARLEGTAGGLPTTSGVATDELVGQGVVQPYDAVTRPLQITGHKVDHSSVPATPTRPVPLPTPAPDVLQSTRHHALWWGLGGGAALVVAVMLRPVLSRRRS